MTGLLRWLEKDIAILFRCLSLDAKLIAEPVRWDILFWPSEICNCRFWCAGACSLCWGLPEKSWKFPPPIPPRYSHYFTSHTHPITLHSHPIPYILIQSRHSPLPWQLTDRVSQQIGTWWDGFANSFIILIFARQSELVLCRSVWECHQIWP